MTKKELSQCYHLQREIEDDRERLARLREEAKRAPAPTLSDTPPGPHNGDSRTERLVAEILDLEAIIAAKQILRIHELAKLERYISDIDDSFTRRIFAFRHVDGLSWEQVAARVGGSNTSDGVRKVHDRYLQKKE